MLALRPRRYRRLLKEVYRNECRSILEVGTYDGTHAKQMIETAAIFWPPAAVNYYGFDLFEDLSEEDLEHEFSKRPPPQSVVYEKLKSTGGEIKLYKGYTRDTLPTFVQSDIAPDEVDLIFIDGGHAVETIKQDWENVRNLMGSDTVVIFDDFYPNPGPQLEGLGCQTIIEGLDRDQYMIDILCPEDEFVKVWGTLKIRMVKVTRRI